MSYQIPEFFESRAEAPVYVDFGISNRQRRALRGPSANQRRNAARQSQAESGIRIRISRQVINQADFAPELKIWIPSVQDGVASRKSLGNLAMTVFDTTQQPLRYCDDISTESLEEDLESKYPELFRRTDPLEVTGTAFFGNRKSPFIGLTFAPGRAYDEIQQVRQLVAPELALDSSHQLSHQPHVSLGQVFSYDRALELKEKLDPVTPRYVQLAPAKVEVDHNL